MVDNAPLWIPTPDRIAEAPITAFMVEASARAARPFPPMPSCIAGRWTAARFLEPALGFLRRRRQTRANACSPTATSMPGAAFFPMRS